MKLVVLACACVTVVTCAPASQEDAWEEKPSEALQTNAEATCASRKAYKVIGGLHTMTCGDGCHVAQKLGGAFSFMKDPTKANGCGAGSFKKPHTFPFTLACQFHDLCYCRCLDGVTQKVCDDMFYRLMNEAMLEKMPKSKQGRFKFLNGYDANKMKQTDPMDMYEIVRSAVGSYAFRGAVNQCCKCQATKPAVDLSWFDFIRADIAGKHKYTGINSA